MVIHSKINSTSLQLTAQIFGHLTIITTRQCTYVKIHIQILKNCKQFNQILLIRGTKCKIFRINHWKLHTDWLIFWVQGRVCPSVSVVVTVLKYAYLALYPVCMSCRNALLEFCWLNCVPVSIVSPCSYVQFVRDWGRCHDCPQLPQEWPIEPLDKREWETEAIRSV